MSEKTETLLDMAVSNFEDVEMLLNAYEEGGHVHGRRVNNASCILQQTVVITLKHVLSNAKVEAPMTYDVEALLLAVTDSVADFPASMAIRLAAFSSRFNNWYVHARYVPNYFAPYDEVCQARDLIGDLIKYAGGELAG